MPRWRRGACAGGVGACRAAFFSPSIFARGLRFGRLFDPTHCTARGIICRYGRRDDGTPMQPIPERDIQPVAVFDFDGTSIGGQSGALVTCYLFMHGYMSLARAGRLLWWGVRYKLHLPYHQDEARELVFGALCGRSSEEVDAILAQFHDEVLNPLYRPQAIEEVRRCHEQGISVLLVSATFEPIAAIAAKRMGVDGFAATRMARDAQGRYTGKVDGPVVAGEEKYRAAERWCNERFGPGGWRLERAYGDHHTDADLLSRARHAYAVCPGTTLEVSAKRNGWEILDWED